MITKKTVFVLGAGASMHYGYPSGETLLREIQKILNAPDSFAHKVINELSHYGHIEGDIKRFAKALGETGRSSIDAFLEHRPEFIDIGKHFIASVLIPNEKAEPLSATARNLKMGNWFQYLYNKMNSKFEEFGDNQISFVTLNYDRSLEHFLFSALQADYGKGENDCAEQLDKIPIIHVHGQLGLLPWQDKKAGRAYASGIDIERKREEFQTSARAIKIIHEVENADDIPEFIKAQRLMNEANQIYFLGFGYDPTNCKRLKIPDSSVWKAGTGYGLLHQERREVGKLLGYRPEGSKYGRGDVPVLQLSPMQVDCLEFLREFAELT
ncbi:hypothetical protein [Desulfatibacillum alkenivorans]|nr:hypothetical protein [Desulfatibacillum alkenivorans]